MERRVGGLAEQAERGPLIPTYVQPIDGVCFPMQDHAAWVPGVRVVNFIFDQIRDVVESGGKGFDPSLLDSFRDLLVERAEKFPGL